MDVRANPVSTDKKSIILTSSRAKTIPSRSRLTIFILSQFSGALLSAILVLVLFPHWNGEEMLRNNVASKLSREFIKHEN